MKHIWQYGLLALVLAAGPVSAQTTVVTQPQAVTTANASSTIGTGGGTFQSIWTADATTRGRVGCTVVNYGTHLMYVFAGPIASATDATSVQLAAGQAFYCSTGNGGVLKDQISIDGTSGDAFYAAIQ